MFLFAVIFFSFFIRILSLSSSSSSSCCCRYRRLVRSLCSRTGFSSRFSGPSGPESEDQAALPCRKFADSQDSSKTDVVNVSVVGTTSPPPPYFTRCYSFVSRTWGVLGRPTESNGCPAQFGSLPYAPPSPSFRLLLAGWSANQSIGVLGFSAVTSDGAAATWIVVGPRVLLGSTVIRKCKYSRNAAGALTSC